MQRMQKLKPVVVRSINAPDGVRCVDILAHPEGDFSFREYRRDVEDIAGWRAIDGADSDGASIERKATERRSTERWPSESEALSRACARVPWLVDDVD